MTMRATKNLALTTAMAATLSALAGCSSGNDWDDNVVAERDTAVCVDQSGKRIADAGCTTQRSGGGGMGSAAMLGYWYYMGRNSRVPYIGDSVNDGSGRFIGSSRPSAGTSYASAPPAANMTRSAAVARGGFGSSGRGFGGGRS